MVPAAASTRDTLTFFYVARLVTNGGARGEGVLAQGVLEGAQGVGVLAQGVLGGAQGVGVLAQGVLVGAQGVGVLAHGVGVLAHGVGSLMIMMYQPAWGAPETAPGVHIHATSHSSAARKK